MIPSYNHPARTAECVATLDLLSDGRVDLGIGEGATRLELGAFGIKAKTKRARSLEAAEQICNMMVLTPYPGFEGEGFSMPCRNVLPKPVQRPHPPVWMACTNRETIKVAARNGVGALAFSFLDPDEARNWSKIYYDIIRSDECVPLGHAVNPNLAMVSAFSMHEDRAEAIRRGQDHFEFFRYAQQKLVAEDFVPGYSDMWNEFKEKRGDASDRLIQAALTRAEFDGAGIGTPADMERHLRGLPGGGGRPGHLHAAGGAQLPREHLRIAGALRPHGDAEVPGRGGGARGAQGGVAPAAPRGRGGPQAVHAAHRPRGRAGRSGGGEGGHLRRTRGGPEERRRLKPGWESAPQKPSVRGQWGRILKNKFHMENSSQFQLRIASLFL